MKIQLQPSRWTEGTVLVATVGFCAILGILIGSYLCLIQTERLGVARERAWDGAIVVAETGIEEAMAHLNSGINTNNLATNAWITTSNGVVTKTNFLDGNYSVISIKIPPAVTNSNPVITSSGYVQAPRSGPVLTRTIQVGTKSKSAGGAAIVAQGAISLSGGKIIVDSFDSSDPNYSTGGIYDPAKAKANAKVITTSTLSNAMVVADGQIYGSTHTVPGVQTILDTTKQSTGSVGDQNWVTNGNIGIQSGHASQDASYNFTTVSLPSLAWLQPVALKGGNALKTNGVTFPYVLDSTSPWQILDLSGAIYVKDPNVVLYVSSTLSLGTGTEIFLAPGASLTMYVGAASASIGGQGIVNSSGAARNFVYYGLPSNTSLSLGANASMTGQFYAPQADVTLGGGGSTPYDFSGQIVGNSFKMNGHFSVHYDENLSPALAGYVAASWAEL